MSNGTVSLPKMLRAIEGFVLDEARVKPLVGERYATLAEQVGYVAYCASLLHKLHESDSGFVNTEELLKHNFRPVLESLHSLNDLDAAQARFEETKERIIGTVFSWPSDKDQVQKELVRGVIHMLKRHPKMPAEVHEIVRDAKAARVDLIDDHAKYQKLHEKVAGLQTTLAEELGRLGVASKAAAFSEQAAKDKRVGIGAIIAGVVLALSVLLLVSIDWFWLHAGGQTTYDYIRCTLSKSFVLLTLVSGALVAVRLFMAMRHNVIVNNHRANALSTFDTFINATEDKQVRDAVLLECTRAIFSPQPTGLTKSGSTEAGGENSVFALMQKVMMKDGVG